MVNARFRGIRPGVAGVCVGVAVVAASPAGAATQTSTMAVSATVADHCTITATPVAFGAVNVISGSPATATGGITVKCTNGTSWTATASVGSGSGATVATRKMTHSVDTSKTLDYVLYTDSGRSTVWGNGTTGTSITDSGTGSDDARTIYASIPTGQHAATLGGYTDSVTVTVTY